MVLYMRFILITLAIITLQPFCGDNFNEIISNEKIIIDKEPIPGSDGTISPGNVSSNSITLYWEKASDTDTPQSSLQYQIYMSFADNINTFNEAQINGTQITFGWTVDLYSIDIDGLSEGTTYYFNVFVRDDDNFIAAYSNVTITTDVIPMDLPPVPGNSGIITVSNITTTGLTLNWVEATDAVTPKTSLQYQVYRSSADNINTFNDAQINGTQVTFGWIVDLDSIDVDGLLEGTAYYFNVFVRDDDNLIAAYSNVSVTTDTIPMNLPPVPGNTGIIEVSNITTTLLTLNWVKATDTVTPQASLQYQVYRSSADNITTIADAQINGIQVTSGWTVDLNSIDVEGLSEGTTYYFNIFVRDSDNFIAAYSNVSVTTDTTPMDLLPVPGNNGIITVSNITTTGLTLNWVEATDDVTPQVSLQYQVYRSAADNITTLAEAQINGIQVTSGWTFDINTIDVTGLTEDVLYYFNVFVLDTDSNTARYTSISEVIEENYNVDWTDSINITINAQTYLSADLNNFPLLIRLDTTNLPDIATKTKSGGADIRFAKTDGTHLPYEIEDWVDGTSGTVWVLVDTVSSSAATIIRMYYNNTNADSNSDPGLVFDIANGFQGVWHLNEDATDGETTANHIDSTLNSNDGIQGGNNDVDSIIANGQSFDGVNDLVDAGTDESLNITGAITLSTWINMSVRPDTDKWYSLISKTNAEYNIYLYGKSATETILAVDFKGIGDFYNNPTQDIDIPAGEWVYVTTTYDGAEFKTYTNGVLDHTETIAGTIDDSSGVNLYLGGDDDKNFPGFMDEARVSNSARSAEWIKLSYENQKANQTLVDIN